MPETEALFIRRCTRPANARPSEPQIPVPFDGIPTLA